MWAPQFLEASVLFAILKFLSYITDHPVLRSLRSAYLYRVFPSTPRPQPSRPIWIHGNLHVRTACVEFKVYMTGLTLDIESVLSSIYGLDNEGLLPPLKGIKTFSVPFGVFRVGFEMFVSVDSVEKVAAMMNHDFLIRFAGMYPRKIKMCTSICNTQIQTMSFSSQNLSITSQNLSSFGAEMFL